MLRALGSVASIANSFSFASMSGAGMRRSLRGGEGASEVDRVDRVEDAGETRVMVAVPLLSWDS